MRPSGPLAKRSRSTAMADAARVVLGRDSARAVSPDTPDPADLSAARESPSAASMPAASSSRAHRVGDRSGGGAVSRRSVRRRRRAVRDPSLDRSVVLGTAAHERVLDWWATALDRQASCAADGATPDLSTPGSSTRMAAEIAIDAGSTPAGYWLAAAARGAGDLERALEGRDCRVGPRRARRDRRSRAARRSRSARDAGHPAGTRRAAQDCAIFARLLAGMVGEWKRSRRAGRGKRQLAEPAAASALRFLPVLADPDVDRQRHAQRAPRLPSARAPPRPFRRPPRFGASNSSSSWTVRIIRARPPATRPSAAWTSIIARLRMSAAVP